VYNGGICALPGDTIDYTFVVTSPGNVSVSNVVVSDPLLEAPNPVVTIAGPSGDDGDDILQVTETWTYTAIYAITQADIDAGVVNNTATVDGLAPNGDAVTDNSNAVLTALPMECNPSIEIVKTEDYRDCGPVNEFCTEVGDPIDYTFVVTNPGNVSLYNIMITDPIIDVSGIPIALVSGDVNFDQILQTTETWVFEATHILTQANIDSVQTSDNLFVNTATVTGTSLIGNDDVSATDSAESELCICTLFGIKLIESTTKSMSEGCLQAGDIIDFDVEIKNTGNLTKTDFNIVSIGPQEVEFFGGDLAILKVGDENTTQFRGEYTLTQADINRGSITVQGKSTAENPDGTEISDETDFDSYDLDRPTIIEFSPDCASISLLKTGVVNDNNGNDFSDEGDTISYMFTVENTGEVPLYNITLEDTNFGIIIGDDPTINPLSPGIVIVGGPLDVLLPGETDDTTFTATYTLTSSAGPFEDPDDNDGFLSRIIFNQATVSGETESGNSDTIVTDLSDDPNVITDIDVDGDGDPDDPSKVILIDKVLAPFEIYNGITPDGDGKNDFFFVQGISNWPVNNVQIFNRWGVLVFETDGYGGSNDSENVFVGVSEGRSTIAENDRLPTGTYYYIINFAGDNNPGKSSYAGYLYINR
jgi:gliding motility-associated-like protein